MQVEDAFMALIVI